MEFDFSAMSNEELENRAAAIQTEMDAEGADLDALEAEARALSQEAEARAAEQRRVEQRSAIAAGAGTVTRNLREEHNNMPETRNYNASSPEYRNAWLKRLAVCQGSYLFGAPNEEEQRAFTMTTANTPNVVPTEVVNRIVELVESQAPMYEDATHMNMVRGFAVPRLTAIVAGDAKGVAEGTANEDEEDKFDQLALSGIEIKKHVVISRKMQFQSIDAFEAWLVAHLAKRIAVARERLIMARLDGKAPEGGSIVANAGIQAGNIVESTPATDAGIRGLFAKLKGTGARVLYANNNTIWNTIAGIENDMKQKLFIPNAMEDPVVAGRVYGAVVKQDDNLADGVVYLGVKGAVLANDFIPTEIFHNMDPKTAADIALAYTLFDAGLENPASFAKTTLVAAGA